MAMRAPASLQILRIGMGVFLALWGIDKIVALEGAERIFSNFYLVDLTGIAVRAFGVAEIALAILLIGGWYARPVAWIVLIVNGVSTAASWKQILDPWGLFGLTRGGAHLFLASIVIMAVCIVLVLEAEPKPIAPAT